ncbi:MAG TPA: zinc-binding dehydrogenase, partial [Burkholderiaceae bacterium]
EPQHNTEMLMQLAQWYGQGKIKPVLDRIMPLGELPAAFERMGSRQVVGKLVLTP